MGGNRVDFEMAPCIVLGGVGGTPYNSVAAMGATAA
jgi:hypothetical protein